MNGNQLIISRAVKQAGSKVEFEKHLDKIKALGVESLEESVRSHSAFNMAVSYYMASSNEENGIQLPELSPEEKKEMVVENETFELPSQEDAEQPQNEQEEN